MAEIVTFQSIENPLEKLVTDAGKNAADILCPKETCKCVVFRKNTASLVERDGAKVIVSPRQWQGC
jgi:putative transposon-encoded protein